MVDIDLSSFGLDWDAFVRDGQRLREENPHVSDADYYRNQKKFQSALLARPRFYLSDYFYQHYEHQARANVSRYLEQIRELI
jgi:predicted metal-dependent HD superfamily phosphohydrolase